MTEAQEKWLEELSKNGWATHCLNSFEGCKDVIDKYFKNDI